MTTQELLIEWLECYEKERVKARTYWRYHGIIELHILPELGDTEISSLTRRRIQEFLTHKKKEGNTRSGEQLSSTSTNLMLTVLNLAFEYACDMELIEESPCVKLKRVPEDSRKISSFTKDEQRRVESLIETKADRRLFGILLCLYSELRIGELLALEWNDVDLENGIITIDKTVYREKDNCGKWQLCVDKPKTKSSERSIPLPSHIVEQLVEYQKHSVSSYVVENKKRRANVNTLVPIYIRKTN